MTQAVNILQKKQHSFVQKPQRENRSTTHIRVKKALKYELEKYMKKHHVKTYSQAIQKLLVDANENEKSLGDLL